jgi:enediyne biosynthesis protein CalE5
MRAGMHQMWSSVAPAWDEHADFVERRAAGLTERMLELAALTEGERVLELACGPAGVGLRASELVGPGGEVVLSDAAPGMVEFAAHRAEGLANVSTKVLDLEEIDEPDDRFDAALCREGLMMAVDPQRAAGEVARVLAPGGRAVISVWGPRERNPWLGLVLDAVSEQVGAPIPPPGMPGPFALDDAGRLSGVLVGGGLQDVAVEEVDVPLSAPSFEDWWDRTSALGGPMAKMIESLPEEAREQLVGRAREKAAAYSDGDGLEFPGVSLVALARAG